MNKLALLTLALATSAITASAQRSTVNLKTWQFSRDSVNYKPVTIPHDWAINGPFDKKWDLQFVAIVQNGETEKTEKSGRSGALPWIGRGFYKTTVDLKKLPKTAILEFDGAMADPHVYINGKLAGHWAYGYNAFRVDALPCQRHQQAGFLSKASCPHYLYLYRCSPPPCHRLSTPCGNSIPKD